MPARVEPDALDLHGLIAAASPYERVQAGDYLGQGKGLGDVIVAAGAEARQAVGEGVARGQEQHRSPHTSSSQRLADVAAIGIGKADVQD